MHKRYLPEKNIEKATYQIMVLFDMKISEQNRYLLSFVLREGNNCSKSSISILYISIFLNKYI